MTFPQFKTISRLAALALLIATFSLVIMIVVMPLVREYQKSVHDIRKNHFTLNKLNLTSQREAALKRSVNDFKKNNRLQDLLISKQSSSAATALIQTKLQSIISNAGGHTVSFQALDPVDEKGLRRIGLRVQFAVDIVALRKVLYALEHGQPIMVLDNFFVHSRSSRAVGSIKPLNVRVDIATYMLNES